MPFPHFRVKDHLTPGFGTRRVEVSRPDATFVKRGGEPRDETERARATLFVLPHTDHPFLSHQRGRRARWRRRVRQRNEDTNNERDDISPLTRSKLGTTRIQVISPTATTFRPTPWRLTSPWLTTISHPSPLPDPLRSHPPFNHSTPEPPPPHRPAPPLRPTSLRQLTPRASPSSTRRPHSDLAPRRVGIRWSGQDLPVSRRRD